MALDLAVAESSGGDAYVRVTAVTVPVVGLPVTSHT
jgi:hypothetical protein